jgi:hypothetical protein
VVFGLPACRAPRATETEVREVAKELGPGRFDLTDTRGGLAELSSYRSVLTVSFDGSRAGQPLRWSRTSTLQATKSPPARRLTVAVSGTGAESGETSLAEKNGAAYAWSATNPCTATSLDPANSTLQQMEPAASLTGVLGAEEAGRETLNGAETTRYTFDERALAESSLNKSRGELWLATKGGYLVRYRLTTTGDSTYFRDATRGTLTWDYELKEINRPLSIDLPAACAPGLVDAPMLPGASDVQSQPGVLQYHTTTSLADAVAFYKKQFVALGWTPPSQSNPMQDALLAADPEVRQAMKALGVNLPGQAPPANEDQAYLLFHRGSQVLRVLVTRGESATGVLVLLGNAGK